MTDPDVVLSCSISGTLYSTMVISCSTTPPSEPSCMSNFVALPANTFTPVTRLD